MSLITEKASPSELTVQLKFCHLLAVQPQAMLLKCCWGSGSLSRPTEMICVQQSFPTSVFWLNYRYAEITTPPPLEQRGGRTLRLDHLLKCTNMILFCVWRILNKVRNHQCWVPAQCLIHVYSPTTPKSSSFLNCKWELLYITWEHLKSNEAMLKLINKMPSS